MRIEPRYYTEWIDKEDTFSIRLNGGNRNRELFGRGYDTSVKTIQEWFDQLEPRLYPSGNFVNAGPIIFDEIKRLEKAQQQAAEKQPGPCDVSAQWRNIGPFARQTDPLAQETNASNSLSAHPSAVPGIGRVNFIKKHPSITGTIYIGASNGGLWKSTDSGSTWQVLNDKIAVLGTSDLVFDPANANTMYLATGDKSRGGKSAIGVTTYSIGVLKSIDGGITWNTLAPVVKWSGLSNDVEQYHGMKINKLLLTASGDLLIGTTDSEITSNGVCEAGIYKWNVANSTWEVKLTPMYAGLCNAITDILQLPNGDIICSSQLGILYRSTDGGNNFSATNTAPGSILPILTDPGRTELAQSHLNGNTFYVVYALVNSAFGGLFKTTDGGASFTSLSLDISTTAILCSACKEHLGIEVSETNDNVLFMGSNQEIYKITVNPTAPHSVAAKTLYIRSASSDEDYVHADVKDFEWVGNDLYVATDGGIAKTSDNGETWTPWYELTRDLCITEAYRIGGLASNKNIVYAGTHDNGIWRLNDNAAAPTLKWQNVKEGDCGEVVVASDTEAYTYYFTTPAIRRIKGPNSNNQYTTPAVIVGFGPYLSTSTNTTLALDGNNNIYVGNLDLFKGSINSNTAISCNNVTTIGFTSPIGWSNQPLSTIAIAPSNPNVIYISKRNGLSTGPAVYRSDDAGATWLPVYVNSTIYGSTPPTPLAPNQQLPALSLNRLVVDPANPQRLWAVFSGYTYNQKVYESADGGATWRNITGGGLPNLPVNAIAAFEDGGLLHLVVGTDVGVYYSNSTLLACKLPQWKPLMQGVTANASFPNVIVQDVEIHGSGTDRVLRAATFGRGIWETPLPTIGTSGCTCSICGDEDYPLQAHFTAAPDGITSTINPNFEVEANWLQWMTVLFPIKLVDASTGLMPADGYEWAFTGNTSLPLNCDGDFLSNDPCASVAWLEAGTHTATLTVTDTEGCTSSFSRSFDIAAYEPDCDMGVTLEVSLQHPTQTCNLTTATCPQANANGSLSIAPISIELGSGGYNYHIIRAY